MSEQQSSFSGWARVEIMGHQSHIGYVSTEAYGQAVLFRIDTPALPEREFTLLKPEWANNGLLPAGTKVKREAAAGISVLIGSGSIYRILPCSEAAALYAIEESTRRALKVVELPAGMQIEGASGVDAEFEPDEEEEDDERESRF